MKDEWDMPSLQLTPPKAIPTPPKATPTEEMPCCRREMTEEKRDASRERAKDNRKEEGGTEKSVRRPTNLLSLRIPGGPTDTLICSTRAEKVAAASEASAPLAPSGLAQASGRSDEVTAATRAVAGASSVEAAGQGVGHQKADEFAPAVQNVVEGSLACGKAVGESSACKPDPRESIGQDTVHKAPVVQHTNAVAEEHFEDPAAERRSSATWSSMQSAEERREEPTATIRSSAACSGTHFATETALAPGNAVKEAATSATANPRAMAEAKEAMEGAGCPERTRGNAPVRATKEVSAPKNACGQTSGPGDAAREAAILDETTEASLPGDATGQLFNPQIATEEAAEPMEAVGNATGHSSGLPLLVQSVAERATTICAKAPPEEVISEESATSEAVPEGLEQELAREGPGASSTAHGPTAKAPKEADASFSETMMQHAHHSGSLQFLPLVLMAEDSSSSPLHSLRIVLEACAEPYVPASSIQEAVATKRVVGHKDRAPPDGVLKRNNNLQVSDVASLLALLHQEMEDLQKEQQEAECRRVKRSTAVLEAMMAYIPDSSSLLFLQMLMKASAQRTTTAASGDHCVTELGLKQPVVLESIPVETAANEIVAEKLRPQECATEPPAVKTAALRVPAACKPDTREFVGQDFASEAPIAQNTVAVVHHDRSTAQEYSSAEYSSHEEPPAGISKNAACSVTHFATETAASNILATTAVAKAGTGWRALELCALVLAKQSLHYPPLDALMSAAEILSSKVLPQEPQTQVAAVAPAPLADTCSSPTPVHCSAGHEGGPPSLGLGSPVQSKVAGSTVDASQWQNQRNTASPGTSSVQSENGPSPESSQANSRTNTPSTLRQRGSSPWDKVISWFSPRGRRTRSVAAPSGATPGIPTSSRPPTAPVPRPPAPPRSPNTFKFSRPPTAPVPGPRSRQSCNL